MIRILQLVGLLLTLSPLSAQDKLPYSEVPDYPENFTAGTIAARTVDALGFRYYWATDSLTEKDLAYKSNDASRSSEETIRHIYNLSEIISNSAIKESNTRVQEKLTYSQMRSRTLNNLKTAADLFRVSDDMSQYKIIFGDRVIPFWNLINGPIADAIWHCGQLAANRRASGNPINPKVNHFTGRIDN